MGVEILTVTSAASDLTEIASHKPVHPAASICRVQFTGAPKMIEALAALQNSCSILVPSLCQSPFSQKGKFHAIQNALSSDGAADETVQ
jgi:hypothetical protein